ncbi:MAG: NAD(P)-dependent oxidoreductase [Sphingobium sp.]|uniref:NAD(P)-dependent oxidoreductase n=1 Tax=Sphingobium sp. TaxID=1912891 RepID=UPI0029BA78F7|nr:NAD(P)-dependent oxidoreductase [Sphingobium sp.]MDX3910672.1 NAD(P)-dependent oxidoreductase [Sphingobium sp.]
MIPVGFIGLGLMGQPMAVNLALSGVPLIVWNRTPAKLEPAVSGGAVAASNVEEVFARCETIILMLATPAAIDSVLGRGTPRLPTRVAGKLIINTGTTSPEYSSGLASEICAAGGRYVEAPVSGSRQQAQDSQLVAMVAGEPKDIASARAWLKAICRETFDCGPVPGGLKMKLAVNHFMIVMVTGLVEAFHFADRAGIDCAALREVLAASPMASNVSQVKASKLVSEDWRPQATIADVLKNVDLIANATAAAGASSPLMRTCRELYREAITLDRGGLDMVAVTEAFHRRSAAPDAG